MPGHPVGGALWNSDSAPGLEVLTQGDEMVVENDVVDPSQELSTWKEPILQFDPGITDKLDDHESTDPSNYVDNFVLTPRRNAEVTEFSQSLLRGEQPPTWPSNWEHRNMWHSTCPIHPRGADTALDTDSARLNYADWLSSTSNTNELLQVLATQDELPQLMSSPRPSVVTLPNLDATKPDITPFVTRSTQYWHDLPPERVRELERILDEAYELASRDYGVSEAIVAGGGYRIPTDLLTRDLHHLVQHQGNISEMTSFVQTTRSDQRLSIDRIVSSLDRVGIRGRTPRETLQPSTVIDTIRLARLASEGITIPRYDGFSPNLRPPNPKAIYREVHSAVNCTLLQLWEQLLVFIVPTVVLHAVGGCHWTPVGWTTKVGKPLGRYLFDARSKSAGTPLNSYTPAYLESIRQEWGPLTLPTIVDLVRMILDFERSQRELLGDAFVPSSIVLFKGDLSKAFTLLSFSPDSVELTASELYQPSWDPLTPEQQRLYDSLLSLIPGGGTTSGDTPSQSWSMLYHTGSFGLRILPFVFGVVSRFLLFLLYVAIWGYIKAYVDDFMGVTSLDHLSHDIAVICEVVNLLLGPHAVEWSKFYAGRQIEWIGWRIDLDTRSVSFGHRNFLKVLHGFLSFDASKHVQGRHILRLASWASRYTTVLRVLSPFTSILYSQIAGLKNIDAFILLDESTIVVIWMWRATLLQLAANPSSFSRPLDTFSSDASHCLLEYDSCLTGFGFRNFPGDLTDLPLAVSRVLERPFCGQTVLPFACGVNSAFQNTAEFTAPTMGLVAMARLGCRHLRISLRGDSKNLFGLE